MNGVDQFEQFVQSHHNQLQTSVIPEHFWKTLHEKLSHGIFDAGNKFSLMQEFLDEDEMDMRWKVVVVNEDGVKANDGKEIYLVDHAWTFRPQTARQHLETIPG
eukprot:10906.XXX_178671_181369_1 [CDS] Oithona nana genome sequencing.